MVAVFFFCFVFLNFCLFQISTSTWCHNFLPLTILSTPFILSVAMGTDVCLTRGALQWLWPVKRMVLHKGTSRWKAKLMVCVYSSRTYMSFVDFYGRCIGKYTSPMDAVEICLLYTCNTAIHLSSQIFTLVEQFNIQEEYSHIGAFTQKTGIGKLYYNVGTILKSVPLDAVYTYIFVGYAIPPSGPSYLFRARFCRISTEKSSPFDWFFVGNSQMYHLRLRCFLCWCEHINSWEFWTSIVDGRKPKQPAGMDKTLGNHGINYQLNWWRMFLPSTVWTFQSSHNQGWDYSLLATSMRLDPLHSLVNFEQQNRRSCLFFVHFAWGSLEHQHQESSFFCVCLIIRWRKVSVPNCCLKIDSVCSSQCITVIFSAWNFQRYEKHIASWPWSTTQTKGRNTGALCCFWRYVRIRFWSLWEVT